MPLHPIVDERSQKILDELSCPALDALLLDAINLMEPAKLYIQTDAAEDVQYIREQALACGEEAHLAAKGHTFHFDGEKDQGRDKEHTCVLLDDQTGLDAEIKTMDRKEGTEEVRKVMKGCMKGKTLLLCFFCLGPAHSRFTKTAVQFTDSFYVVHSENVLYRNGFDHFRASFKGQPADGRTFFAFYHSCGRVNERMQPMDVADRRIYIDPVTNLVYTINNSYAGNSLACKKLALRLAIYDSNWHYRDHLTEHMFLSEFPVPGKPGEHVYVCGAFPSACGKTSTSMCPGAHIVGDDIVYMENVDGVCKAVNIEQGMFGIIAGVNPEDDPLIYKCLTSERELIFSNVLVGSDGKPYWDGMSSLPKEEWAAKDLPEAGTSFKGPWTKGTWPIMHGNARFTLRLSELDNVSSKLNDPEGCEVGVILYGGRDADTCPPVYEALDWCHGVYIGSAIESATTAATLGAQGVVKSSPMANLDFLVVPIPLYLKNHIAFGTKLGANAPKVYGVNYFLKGANGQFLNTKLDKKVWISWACGRTKGLFEALETPLGRIPKYEDLRKLMAEEFNGRVYTREEYDEQFSIRAAKYLEKIARIEKLYAAGAPAEWLAVQDRLRAGLEKLVSEAGPVVLPSHFEK